jgi:hypothetical protein
MPFIEPLPFDFQYGHHIAGRKYIALLKALG